MVIVIGEFRGQWSTLGDFHYCVLYCYWEKVSSWTWGSHFLLNRQARIFLLSLKALDGQFELSLDSQSQVFMFESKGSTHWNISPDLNFKFLEIDCRIRGLGQGLTDRHRSPQKGKIYQLPLWKTSKTQRLSCAWLHSFGHCVGTWNVSSRGR